MHRHLYHSKSPWQPGQDSTLSEGLSGAVSVRLRPHLLAWCGGYRNYFQCSAGGGGGGGDDQESDETVERSVASSDASSPPSRHVESNAVGINSNSPDDDSNTPDNTSDSVGQDMSPNEPEADSLEHPLDRANSENIKEQRTVDLSNLSWSNDDGIVIYPDIHFGKKGTDSDLEHEPEQSDDAKFQRQDYNLQTLLYNIQKSRVEKETVTKEKRTAMMSVEELVQFLQEHNAEDVFVVQLPRDLDYVEYFIICTGTGRRHIGRMADSVVSEVRIIMGDLSIID